MAFPSNISTKAKDFMMCCLRKSPFHRKNVTKLLKHPFVKLESLSKMDKSFDDVSALNFDESPKSPANKHPKSYKDFPANVLDELDKIPQKNIKFFNEAAPDYKEDLLNLLKKIEKQKKEDSISHANNPKTKSDRKSMSSKFKEQPIEQRERKRSNNILAPNESPEINFKSEESERSPSKFISEGLYKDPKNHQEKDFHKKKGPVILMKDGSKRHSDTKSYKGDASLEQKPVSEEEVSYISSSEFI